MGWWWIRSCGIVCGLSVCALLFTTVFTDATLGVIYGADGNNLPLPSQAVHIMQSNGVPQVRIYDTNAGMLEAFSNSNIEVIVGMTNDELATIGRSNVSTSQWMTTNIVPYVSKVKIIAIAVGSEVQTSAEVLSSILVQGMRNVHDALIANHLDTQIRVSTPCTIGVLENYYPASQGAFNKTYVPVTHAILSFLSYTGSFFMLNAYPYYFYQANPQTLDLNYALFTPTVVVTDSYTNLTYTSLLDQLVDATYSAMAALNITNVEIVVTETGWPHGGDPDQVAATVPNAQTYNSNLAKRVYNKSGTPLRPLVPVNAYIYELFNENLRAGPSSERNWGLFNADGTAAYAIDLSGSGRPILANNTYQTWCVAKQGVSDAGLQWGLDYACGQGGANCTAVQLGQPCYEPNTLISHASFAFNAYYQKSGDARGTCDFKGVAHITLTNPSYGSCVYQASNITTMDPDQFSAAGISKITQSTSAFTFSFLLLVLTLGSLRYHFQ